MTRRIQTWLNPLASPGGHPIAMVGAARTDRPALTMIPDADRDRLRSTCAGIAR